MMEMKEQACSQHCMARGRGKWVRCGCEGTETGRGFSGTWVEGLKLSSGGVEGRHTQGSTEAQQISAPVPCGPGSGRAGGMCLVAWGLSASEFVCRAGGGRREGPSES